MNFELGVNLTQQQKLVMTQKMQQSVKILEMSGLELKDYVEKVIVENPILEIDYEDKTSKKETDLSNKIDYKEMINYLQFDNYGSGNYELNNDDDEAVSPFNFISAQKSLYDYLEEQISELNIEEYKKEICKFIIDDIDSRGYLVDNDENLAELLKVSAEEIHEAIEIIQDLEPSGIGAHDLKECLLIQLERQGILDDNLYKIITEFLELVGENKYNVIAKELNITVKEVQEYGDLIKTLEPKPSRGFYTGDEVKYIVADATIKRIGDEFIIVMKNDVVPTLMINNMYKDIIKKDDASTSKYVKDKIDSAIFLIKSIEQRKNTLYRVLEEIIRIQKDYFLYGDKYLKPMKLKEISEIIDVHESTVSRAIREKYIDTERGLVKIKDLFTTGLSSSNEEDVSTNNIKKKIKELVDNENKSKPLSDQAITDALVAEQVEISRRTVAKYREEMGIKSSSKRKRF
ncbi:MAG: RNA polymerase factor sigma-54 [Clostridiaceae bacterium]